MNKKSQYTLLLDGMSVEDKRQEIVAYFYNTYELYESVFDILKDDTVFYKKSELTRHPMIFYFGHTATFFINKLINMKIIENRVNPSFESIFAVGVDEMAWDDMENSRYNWPRVSEVREYRLEVKKIITELIMNLPLSLPIKEDDAMWIILMGIEHERIHIETSLVLHRQMPLEFVKDVTHFRACPDSSTHPKNSMVQVEGAEVTLGVEEGSSLYTWDNEYGISTQRVPTFKTSKYLVSNGEYMAFVDDGGYESLDFWDEEGVHFLKKSAIKHPPFWVKVDNGFKYRTLTKLIDMPLDWAVDVNALEAEAFCRYKSHKDGVVYVLPSESEYRLMYERAKIEDIPNFNESKANCNFAHYASSSPVDRFNFNGIYDVVGNVWQWSRTPIRAFEGFKIHQAYDDFSLPTFDEKHALILGSSWASSGNLITKNSRYAFRKHFYQNAGFRYVITKQKTDISQEMYEKDSEVIENCISEYLEKEFKIPNIASSYAKKRVKALDLGCATGRSSFELAKEFQSVDGIDSSARFIKVGVKLKEKGYIAFKRESSSFQITLESLALEKFKERVSFWQGDICNLKENHSGYDLILATSVIDKLYDIPQFVEGIKKRLTQEGIFVISYLQGSSEKYEYLRSYLLDTFELVESSDVMSVWSKR